MPTKQECDAYAIAAVEQFDAFVNWAVTHWPDHQARLSAADFSAGRRELSALLGARLDAAAEEADKSIGTQTSGSPSVGPSDASEQYVNMNPAPWP